MIAKAVLIIVGSMVCSFSLSPLAHGIAEVKVTKLREKIFGKELVSAKSCKVVSRGLKDELAAVDKKLHEFIENFVKNHRDADLTSLKQAFHPRLRMTEGTLKKVFKSFGLNYGNPETFLKKVIKSLGLNYGNPATFTIYRIWALNTVDGSPDHLPCHEDRLAVGPHYGYPLHFGLWIQVMGPKELGRIYASVVPGRGTGWRVGAWHLQQWTHQSKDPQKWVEEALSDFEGKATLPAYVKLDLASKLLDGGGYIYPMFLEDVKVTKSSYLKDTTFQDYIQSIIGSDKKLVYLSSIFARDGAGVLIRMEVPDDTRVSTTKEMCENATARLHEKAGKAELGGIKCSFINPGEDPEKDGRLGTRFIPRQQALLLKAAAAKTSGKSEEPENAPKENPKNE